MNDRPSPTTPTRLKRERWRLLREYNEITERPMIALSFVWLLITIVDFAVGVGTFLQALSYIIWGLFVLDFAVDIVIAPHKRAYLKRNWLTAVSLLLPALRLFRIVRVVRLLQVTRIARSLNLVRLVTSLNRGMRALRVTFGRRGLGFIVVLSIIIVFAGAAGIWFFESPASLQNEGLTQPGDSRTGIASYGDAVWWAAMMLTTLGSEYWPQTVEGRILAFILALYAFAVFGYVTATIASYFVGREAAEPAGSGAGSAEVAALRQEIAALKAQMAGLTAYLQQQSVESPEKRQANSDT